MNKKNIILITVFLVFLLCTLYFSYKYFTKNKNSLNDITNDIITNDLTNDITPDIVLESFKSKKRKKSKKIKKK